MTRWTNLNSPKGNANHLFLLSPVRDIRTERKEFKSGIIENDILSDENVPATEHKTYSTCNTLTIPVKAKKYGLVSTSILLISSSSETEAAPCCLAASLKLAVMVANIWNFQYDMGWKVIWRGKTGVVSLISMYCERRCQNSLGKIIGR